MDAVLRRWGKALVWCNAVGLVLALYGLLRQFSGAPPLWEGGSLVWEPGFLMGLGVVLMLPQTLFLVARHWLTD
ncbi:hypothetical protein [Ferrimonas balearica]|uniref:hypothetical protein n=1 Tax=Ferrimonas balearica TaxID=44012 RepID=UPI001C9A1BB7|nr:hypothetical protein [Ferrimonas balearica]MBY5994151.1 hypothetical protein [Ferrimonas balearica]